MAGHTSSKKRTEEGGNAWKWAELIADVIGGYLSWSLITALPHLFFFYPLVKMDYTGWEGSLGGYLIVGALGSRALRLFAASNLWLFRLLSLVGLIAFHVTPHLEWKIGIVALGMSFDLLGVFATFLCTSKMRRQRAVLGYLCGLITFVIVRMYFLSVDPIFNFLWANYAAAGLGLLATLIHLASKLRGVNPIVDNNSLSSSGPSWKRSGFGVAGVWFLTHLIYSEHGVVSRWVEAPPFPHGVLVIAGMLLGVFISELSFVKSFLWLAVGLGSGFLFSATVTAQGPVFQPEVQLFGGAILAVYLLSVWSSAIEQVATTKNPGKALTLTGFLYIAGHFWSVYVVAYKFMDPIVGPILRERHISLLIACVICCGLGHVESFSFPKRTIKGVSMTFKAVVILLITCGLLVPTTMYRFNKMAEKPDQPPSMHALKAMVWAVHFGYNNEGDLNLAGLVDTIKASGANVIGLVETDGARTVFGNRDIVEYLEHELHLYTDFGPSSAQNTWGCALLSAYPIVSSIRTFLPSPEGELACIVAADLDVNGTLVNVMVSHFGNTEDELDRKLQTEGLAELFAKQNESMFIGYLTANVWDENYSKLMATSGNLRDSSNSYDRYCEYVLFKDLELLDFYRIDKGEISDTEAQIAVFLLEDKDKRKKEEENLQRNPLKCREYGQDFKTCGIHRESCGWCQGTPKSLGQCMEPSFSFQAGCLYFGGFWVGPNATKQNTLSDTDKSAFVDYVYQAQQEGVAPIEKRGKGKFLWTIKNYYVVDMERKNFDSALFEHDGIVWQASIFRKNKAGLTKLGVGITMIPNQLEKDEKIEASINVKILHPTIPQKTIQGSSQGLLFTNSSNFWGAAEMITQKEIRTAGYKRNKRQLEIEFQFSSLKKKK